MGLHGLTLRNRLLTPPKAVLRSDRRGRSSFACLFRIECYPETIQNPPPPRPAYLTHGNLTLPGIARYNTHMNADEAQRDQQHPPPARAGHAPSKTKKRVRNFTADDRAAHREFEKGRRKAFRERLTVRGSLPPPLSPC